MARGRRYNECSSIPNGGPEWARAVGRLIRTCALRIAPSPRDGVKAALRREPGSRSRETDAASIRHHKFDENNAGWLAVREELQTASKQSRDGRKAFASTSRRAGWKRTFVCN